MFVQCGTSFGQFLGGSQDLSLVNQINKIDLASRGQVIKASFREVSPNYAAGKLSWLASLGNTKISTP